MSYEILVIEDRYEDIHILDAILHEGGYTVRVARDGKSGLRTSCYKIPDLILLDVMLPDMDGLEICKLIRAEEKLAMVPIIFVSVTDDVSIKERAFEVGAFDYITKPFNSHEILIRIEHQLERICLRRQMDDNIRLQERYHLARELHDSVNQTLFVMGISVQSVMMDADKLPPKMFAELKKLNKLSQGAIAEMRTLLNELRPTEIIDTPIPKLMHQLVDAYQLRIDSEISLIVDADDFPDDLKLAFYRITQEALNNVAKYADATQLHISLIDDGLRYQLMIDDNGIGFDPQKVATGMGLNSMKERATQHQIDLTITSHPGQGTKIEAICKHQQSQG